MSFFARSFTRSIFSMPNFVFGNNGDNTLSGTDGRDFMIGFGGDDVFNGGAGNDTILGGRGFDTAEYAGSVSDYTISPLWGASHRLMTVTSNNDSVADAGRDFLLHVEALYFAADDYTLYVDGTNNAVLAGDDIGETSENADLTFDVAALLANDQEFDGDTMTITAVSATSAAGATVTLLDGQIVYSPGTVFDTLNDGETATDTFTYTVDDGKGGTDTATVTVTITGETDVPVVDARINELHYDNAGTDTGEFIEIRTAAGDDVSVLTVELYNGKNGSVYNTLAVSDAVMTTDGTHDYYVFNLPANGLQNGSPDGLALVNGGEVVEFLSYEGTFDATEGAANGMTSTDIGVSEPKSTEIGHSLQRNEDGTWRSPEAETPGATNEAALEARINEFHYDNAGSDTGEFIEVRVNAGGDVSGLTVELLNGKNGTVYNTLSLSDAEKTAGDDYDYYVFNLPANGLQNGSPDGLALVNGGEVVEFLSYEGTFDAAEGAANGMTSTDIGVSEPKSTEIGHSLQRNEDGTWDEPAAHTAGAANDAVIVTPTTTLISAVQGVGDDGSMVGQQVTVSAVVTHITAKGFYIQEEDADADNNALTSEGVYVYTGGGTSVSLSSLVEVTGTVTEYYGMTQIGNVSSVTTIAEVVDMPSAAEIALSTDTAPDYEAVEGMLVTVSSGTPDPLTVIENYNLARYGDMVISAGVQYQPTQLYDAQTEQAEIAALREANENARLKLDDGSTSQNPDQFDYIPGGAGDNGNGMLDAGDDFGDAGSTLRLGAELTAPVQGVMSYGFGDYRVVVTETLEIDEATNSGARQDAPDNVGGSLQVASVNLLNYFSTIDGTGTSGPNGLRPRGADSEEELARQTTKTVAAIKATGAEVLAIQEIENGGFGTGSAAQTLIDALNADADVGVTYAIVDPTNGGDGYIGNDAITTGIIYDSEKVTLLHSEYRVFEEPSAAATFALAEVLHPYVSSGDQIGDYQRNRPSVAATFEDKATGATFTVVSSHFKSKGDSNLQDLADAAQAYLNGGGTGITQADVDALRADPNFDQGDGQGFWNAVRTDGAAELVDWISTDYNGGGVSDYLLLGDMNAYAKEDPVQHLSDSGLTDLIDTYIGQDEAYSYVFDGQRGTLDQGFVSNDLADNITGVTEWHINADEPGLINYDNSYTNSAFYNDGVYASSDHDPLIVGLELSDTILFV